MEYRLSNEPQEIISSLPELIHICQTLCSILEKIDLSDDIAES